MKKSSVAIVSASLTVAVIAVVILALFLTGVISMGNQKVEANQKVEPYDYFCAHGTFNATNEISTLGKNYTRYSWKSTDGVYELSRRDYYNDWGTDIYYNFNFRSETQFGSCSINDTSYNTFDDDKLAYATFLEWCEELGFNPNQIMQVLDQYAASR